ncbi:uncharacterized protein BDV17DRAFT_208428 [Aspergillus undulatus]|uniref:uncharacterized protein n=1 Tax=Aspergillus undulatus TaxID=1810928 RepID=UPI003CCE2A56
MIAVGSHRGLGFGSGIWCRSGLGSSRVFGQPLDLEGRCVTGLYVECEFSISQAGFVMRGEYRQVTEIGVESGRRTCGHLCRLCENKVGKVDRKSTYCLQVGDET